MTNATPAFDLPALKRVVFRVLDTGGTGFFVSNDGWALTCWHVVPEATVRDPSFPIRVQWQGKSLEGRLYKALSSPDAEKDIAVLKFDGEHFPILPLAAMDPELLRDRAICAVGFQEKDRHADSVEIDGAVDRHFALRPIKIVEDDRIIGTQQLLVINPKGRNIEPGSSGGPIVDVESGRIIAMMTARQRGQLWGHLEQVGQVTNGKIIIDEQYFREGYGVPLSEVFQRWPAFIKFCPQIHSPGLDPLADQMKNWFSTLGYGFEDHDIRGPGVFEWILNVPGRLRFDRVVVHGVNGDAGIHHVNALYDSVGRHRADEGWLVAAHQVSPGGRKRASREGNLLCYTFDELLDQHADFSNYAKSLEAEIKKRGIDRFYVPLTCTKKEFDPDGRSVGTAEYEWHDGGIDAYVDQWLEFPGKHHISVLGEFGTGKTWFTLHYAWLQLQRYRDAQQRRIARPRLPLVILLRDYAKASSIESLLSEFIFRKYQIPLPGYRAFELLNRMGKLLLIFDGFDEMAARVDRERMNDNFREFTRVVVPGSKVLLTSRTEYFPEATIEHELLSSGHFEILRLAKLDDEQVRQVLLFRTPPHKVERVMAKPALLELARRPVLIPFIVESLEDIEPDGPLDMARIYFLAVRRKMERELQTGTTFSSSADKLYFLCELSWEMLRTTRLELNWREFPKRLGRLFGITKPKELDHWQFEMLARTLLDKTETGDYFLVHRSLVEFFVAYKFIAEMGMMSEAFITLAREQSHLDYNLPTNDYTWSEYFRRDHDGGGNVRRIAPLGVFKAEELSHVVATAVNVDQLTRNTLPFAADMVSDDADCLQRLCATALDQSGVAAWKAQILLPFLKHRRSVSMLAETLIEKSGPGPIKSGIAWVLGELDVPSPGVLLALRRTVEWPPGDKFFNPKGWWEAAFALEKLHQLGDGKEGPGVGPVSYLSKNLPPGYGTPKEACLKFINHLCAVDVQERVDTCNVIGVAAHAGKIDGGELFEDIRRCVDLSQDTVHRRCYFAVWLCGHLRIRESVQDLVKASRLHPFGSVKNIAVEALGKIGDASPDVIAALEERLGDNYYRVRYHAAWSLGELGSVRSTSKLAAAIEDEEVVDVVKEMRRANEYLATLAEGDSRQ